MITLPEPEWWSNLTSIILDLEKMRGKEIYSEIPPHIFFQLKEIYQILETLGSARIEWNNTTLSEYVEKIIEKNTLKDENGKEIDNINTALQFIEKNFNTGEKIGKLFVLEIHKIIMQDLQREGSKNPGDFRKWNVKISKSQHIPPDFAVLSEHLDHFFAFINTEHKEQNQLLAIALAHHRFAYIHPFDNGNGRMWRLLNYILLIKLGFIDKRFRIINPSSVFYADREKYYRMLAKADSLQEKDLLDWCEYFLLGLKNEVEKIDSLLDARYVKNEILLPAIEIARKREIITDREFQVLELIIKKPNMQIKSEELSEIGITDSKKKAQMMKTLRDNTLVFPLKENGRVYTINFVNNYLLRGVIHILDKKWFVSDFLSHN